MPNSGSELLDDDLELTSGDVGYNPATETTTKTYNLMPKEWQDPKVYGDVIDKPTAFDRTMAFEGGFEGNKFGLQKFENRGDKQLTSAYGLTLNDPIVRQNLTPKDIFTGISEAKAKQIATQRYKMAGTELPKLFPTIENQPEPVQEILFDLHYNMGLTGLMKFPSFIKAINTGDYSRAADELEYVNGLIKKNKSKYTKDTGRRAIWNINMLRGVAEIESDPLNPDRSNLAKNIVKTKIKNMVANIQEGLNSLGFNLRVDGKLGSQTRTVIAMFQQRSGLKPTGNIDAPTMQRLNSAVKPQFRMPRVTEEAGALELVPGGLDDNIGLFGQNITPDIANLTTTILTDEEKRELGLIAPTPYPDIDERFRGKDVYADPIPEVPGIDARGTIEGEPLKMPDVTVETIPDIPKELKWKGHVTTYVGAEEKHGSGKSMSQPSESKPKEITNEILAQAGVTPKNYKEILQKDINDITEAQYVAAKQIQQYEQKGEILPIAEAREWYRSAMSESKPLDPTKMGREEFIRGHVKPRDVKRQVIKEWKQQNDIKDIDSSFIRGSEDDSIHSPASPESGSPLYDLTANGTYPKDVYSMNAFRYYGTGEDRMDRQAYSIISAVEGEPNKQVRIYRAVELNDPQKIIPGDWVTTVRAYAKEHGEGTLKGEYKIISKTVTAQDLFTSGDSWLEYGFHPQKPIPRQVYRVNRPQLTQEWEAANKKTAYQKGLENLKDKVDKRKQGR